MNASCNTYECVMSHILMSHVTHMHEVGKNKWRVPWQGLWSESCHTCERVISHTWTSHVTHMHEEGGECLPGRPILWSESCHTCMNESCHTYAWGRWRARWQGRPTLWSESCRTWLNKSCHIYAWGSWRAQWQGRPIKGVISHVWVSHVTHVNQWIHTYEGEVCYRKTALWSESCHTYEWVMSYIWMSRVIVVHMDESRHTYAWGRWKAL